MSIYHITVGEKRPNTVKIGNIERNTGFSVVQERGETLAKRGDCGFPNGTKVWAVRIIRDEKGNIIKDVEKGYPTVAVTDTRYKGELLGLPWGKNGGSIMDVRYLKGYPSLDVLYQDRILNFKVEETSEGSADVYMLTFPNGDNDIDENIDPLLVQHLKWHPYNLNSVSKDPTFFTTMFFEKSFEQEEAQGSQVLDAKFEAGKIVRDAGSGGDGTAKCKNLFSIIKVVTDETPDDQKLYAYLKMLADKKPEQLLKAVEDYKVKVNNVFEKLKSYNAIDLTVDGTIVAGDKKKELIASDIPGKGEGMLLHLLENFADPKCFETTYKLIQITDKLK